MITAIATISQTGNLSPPLLLLVSAYRNTCMIDGYEPRHQKQRSAGLKAERLYARLDLR
jgi:hypothetical protein